MVRNYKRKKCKNYSQKDLDNAISAVEKGCSFRESSHSYNVPLATLHDHVSGKHIKSVGHPTALTNAEEELIISSMEYCSENGYPCDRKDLRNMVQSYSLHHSRDFPWISQPGPDFLRKFEKRWNHRVSLRKPELLTTARVKSLTKDCVESFFGLVEKVYNEHSLHDSPDRIYNLDETGIVIDQWAKKCFFKRGKKKTVLVAPNVGKTMHSILVCISAAGVALPPCVVYKGKHLYDAWTKDSPDGTSFYVTKSGWVDSDVFKAWFVEVSSLLN